MDWLRFSLLTRGFLFEPDGEFVPESSTYEVLLYWLSGVVIMYASGVWELAVDGGRLAGSEMLKGCGVAWNTVSVDCTPIGDGAKCATVGASIVN